MAGRVPRIVDGYPLKRAVKFHFVQSQHTQINRMSSFHGSMFSLQLCRLTQGSYVKRWRVRGQDHLGISGRAALINLLVQKAPDMCWLPLGSKEKVEYYPYIPYKVTEIKMSVIQIGFLFKKLSQNIKELHKWGSYYVDFTPSNILSLSSSFQDSKAATIRCCDIDSFVSEEYITEDLMEFEPSPPERKKGFKTSTVKGSLSNVVLYAYSIWQLGVLMFSLLTKGKAPSWIQEKEEEASATSPILSNPLDCLLPDLSTFTGGGGSTSMKVSKEEFLDLASTPENKVFFKQVLQCLEDKWETRITNFETFM